MMAPCAGHAEERLPLIAPCVVSIDIVIHQVLPTHRRSYAQLPDMGARTGATGS